MTQLSDEVVRVARALARHAGHNPDEEWEEFDRNAGHSAAAMDYPEGWQAETFPKVIRWQEFIATARAAIAAYEAKGDISALQP